MNLQGADAWRQIQDTFHLPCSHCALCSGSLPRLFPKPIHERVGPETQIEIEFKRSVLDQQVFVACLPVHHLNLAVALRNEVEDRSCGCRSPWIRYGGEGLREPE